MQLFVNALQTHTLEVTGQETVNDLKSMIENIEGIPCDDQVIYNCGKPLDDCDVLSQTVSDLATLNVEVRVLGGKVHGSLARAGKVKGQTPKVDKKEDKKKKKTGRAKRRMQYNRRYVNVIATFGRRRGPNSNAA